MLKIKETRKHYPEVEYIEINVESDQVHMVVSFPPKYSIAKIVQIIKTKTSREMFEKFKFLIERYRTRHIWSVGYYVRTECLEEEEIKRYVKYQEKEDLGQAKLAF